VTVNSARVIQDCVRVNGVRADYVIENCVRVNCMRADGAGMNYVRVLKWFFCEWVI